MIALLLACGGQTDAEAYLAASQSPDNPALCDAISSAWLAGECRAMAATHSAGLGDTDGAAVICEQLPEGDPWRDECFFLIADRVTAAGDEALSLCSRAGRFEERCLGHAFGREGRAMLEGIQPGEELATYQALREKSEAYFTDRRTGGKKLRHLMVEFIASRDFEQPFSAATCGTLPETLCRAGFQTRVRFALRNAGQTEHNLHSVCQMPTVTVEAATAVGAPAWTEDAEPVVQAAWRQLCGKPVGPGGVARPRGNQ